MQPRHGVPRIPAATWVLIAAAIVQLLALVAINWYRFFGPFLIVRIDDVVDGLAAVAPFLLAASIFAAAGRWPDANRWLAPGAALVAVHAVANGALVAWWAWWEVHPGTALDVTAAPTVLAVLVSEAAMVAAVLCLAAGIDRSSIGRARAPLARAAGVVAAVIGLAAIGLAVGLLIVEVPALNGVLVVWLTVLYRILTTSLAIGLAILGWVALRAAAPGRGPAMAMIGVGAFVASLGITATWLVQWYVLSANDVGLSWTFQAASLTTTGGLLVIAAGFAAASVRARDVSPAARRLGDSG